MQGLEIRFARRVNRKLDRKGKVFADRFHAVPVRSPRHLRNTLCYVMNNARRHGAIRVAEVRKAGRALFPSRGECGTRRSRSEQKRLGIGSSAR